MNRQDSLLAVLEVIIAAMAIATVAIHQSSDCLHAVVVATTIEIHNVVNTVLLDLVLHD